MAGFEEIIFGTAAGGVVSHGTERLIKRHGLLIAVVAIGGAWLLYHHKLAPRQPPASQVLRL